MIPFVCSRERRACVWSRAAATASRRASNGVLCLVDWRQHHKHSWWLKIRGTRDTVVPTGVTVRAPIIGLTVAPPGAAGACAAGPQPLATNTLPARVATRAITADRRRRTDDLINTVTAGALMSVEVG